MPIAIYRHRKLSVAVTKSLNPVIHNFSSRRIRDLRLSRNIDDSETVQVFFTRIERQRGLVIHHDEEWEFHNGLFRIIHRKLRNGRLVKESVQSAGLMMSTSWSQHRADAWVWDKFEQEQTARCIIEQYLYQYVANPHDYRIVTFDFNPKTTVNNRPVYTAHPLRSVADVETAANTDRSEDSNEWIKLFMGEK